jgi:hypothetical protein
MIKNLLFTLILASAALPALASVDRLQPVACPTEEDLFALLNAADRHDVKETARLVGPVCRPLAGLRYDVQEMVNGVTTIRIFTAKGDWASSELAYTLDEMVQPE